jgi:hypothetical protein
MRRENKMEKPILKVGMQFEYSGKTFVVTGVEMVEAMEGVGIKIVGCDPDFAEHKQKADISMEIMQKNALSAINKMFGRGDMFRGEEG